MFTKLFSSITDSTIWRESDHVRIVWITMLAKADVSGFVWSSIPGLADAARVTLDQCVEALDKLRAPDEWSRSKENEGRRIEEVDGGWRLLNYDKYRKIRNMEERREYVRKKVAEHRQNVNNVNKSKQCKQMLTHAEGEVESSSIAQAQNEIDYTMEFLSFWEEYPKKRSKGDAWKAWRRIKPSSELVAKIMSAVRASKTSLDWLKDGGQFVPYPASWIRASGWEDEVISKPIKIQRDF